MSLRAHLSPFHGIALAFTLALLSLALAACGGGGGGGGGGSTGSTRDPGGSAAAVDSGVTALQDALSAPTPPPFATMADIATQFQTAADLDPENPNAAFFGGLGQFIFFLDGTDAKLFIGKLGWDDFRENDADFQGFINAIGSAVTNATGTGPFTFPVKNPDDPITMWEGGPLSVADLIQFLTVTLPGQLNAAADKLGTIPPDWSYTISIQIGFLGDGGGAAQAPQSVRKPMATSEAVDVRVDYTDAMALRAAFSAAAGVLSAPGIWNFTGVDQFLADHTTDGVLGDIPEADIKAFFAAGQVLSKNQAGLERTLGSLIAAMDSVDKAIDSLRAEQASGRDQSHDLLAINGGLISGALSYDAEGEVISYGLTALQLTATDVKASLSGNHSIGVYQPVAFITDFAVCDPIAASPELTDTDPLTTPPASFSVDQDALTTVTLSGTPSAATVSSGTPAPDGAFYFKVQLSAPANVSVWTEGADTHGEIGYADGNGSPVGWDVDEDSGGGGNFGLSVASAYMNETTMPGVTGGAYTFYVRVTMSANDTAFTLHVQTDNGATWPAGQPIFLKGGGGRNFQGKTYRIASVTSANVGNLVRVAAGAFDDADRSTLVLDDPATDDGNPDTKDDVETFTRLDFAKATLRQRVLSVLPSIAFKPPLDVTTGAVNIMDAIGGVDPTGVLDLDPLFHDADLTPFCAYPKSLMGARLFTGGHSIGVGF